MIKNKIIAFLLLATIVFSLSGCANSDKKSEAYENNSSDNYSDSAENIGNFKTADINGNEVTDDILKDYDLTVINVWTTWCTYCLQEMPYLAELSKEYENQGVQIIGIVDDVKDRRTGEIDKEKLELTKTILQRTGVEYPTILPDDVLSNGIMQSITGYPTTYFVNSKGDLVVEPISGAMQKEQWRDVIEKVLSIMEEDK